MIKSMVKLSDVIDRLNALVKLDPNGTKAVFEARVDVGPAIGGHIIDKHDGDTVYLVGPLGLVNYLFGLNDETKLGPVAACYQVVCSACGLTCSEASRTTDDEPVTTDQVVGATCGACGGKLKLGDLLEFIVTDQGMDKDRDMDAEQKIDALACLRKNIETMERYHRNIVRQVRPHGVPQYRWALIADLMCVGKTKAAEICRVLGVNPDEHLQPIPCEGCPVEIERKREVRIRKRRYPTAAEKRAYWEREYNDDGDPAISWETFDEMYHYCRRCEIWERLDCGVQ